MTAQEKHDEQRMDVDQLLSLAEDLAEVTRLVADDDVPASLARYVRRVVATVPGCHAAFFSAPFRGGVETVAGTWQPASTDPADLGPVADAFAYGEPRRVGDIARDTRYPGFASQLASGGFRSALVLPLSRGTDEPATLTLVSRDPDAFGESSFDLVQLFAAYAGTALDNAALYADSRALVDQLTASLRTRSTIGQAQGLLMAARDLDAAGAFEALRAASQNGNVKLRALAEELVAAQADDRFDDVAAQYGLL